MVYLIYKRTMRGRDGEILQIRAPYLTLEEAVAQADHEISAPLRLATQHVAELELRLKAAHAALRELSNAKQDIVDKVVGEKDETLWKAPL